MTPPTVPATDPRPSGRDRSYGPTVLLGLVGAVVAAVSATREWATARGDAVGLRVEASVTGADSQPLVASLSLVALAAWGVLLVLRGRLRRAVAVVGFASAVGALASLVLGSEETRDDALEAAISRGATTDVFVAGLSAWYYLAGAGALLTAAALAVAVLRAPGWPAMGSRYDAPSARAHGPNDGPTDEDMWRALDEGHDPTS